jgi:spore coat protein CotH
MNKLFQPGFLLFLGLFTLASTPARAHHVGSEIGLALYDPFQVRELNLDMSGENWNTVLNDTTLSIQVPATFWETEDQSMITVSVRRKSADRIGDKVSLKIDINDYYGMPEYPNAVSIWKGVKKLSLENGDDVDVVSEGFAWYLHHLATKTSDDYTDYTPGHAAWTRLIVNGQDMGIYLNVEQRDKTFLRNRNLYTKGSTWLYKAGDKGSNYSLKVGTPDSPTLTSVMCYSPFGAATSGGGGGGGGGGGKGGGKKGGGDTTSTTCEAPKTEAEVTAQLDRYIDMRAILTQGAVEAFTLAPDAMLSKGKNFYFIDSVDPVDGTIKQRRYVPWDLDTVFTTRSAAGSIYGIETKKGRNTTLAQTEYQQLILNNADFRGRYECIMDGLLNGPMNQDAIVGFLNELERVLLAAGLQDDPNNQIDGSVAGHFQSLRQWAKDRVANIKGQLGNLDCSTGL